MKYSFIVLEKTGSCHAFYSCKDINSANKLEESERCPHVSGKSATRANTLTAAM